MDSIRLPALAAALAISISAGAAAQAPLEPAMVEIEGGSYPIGSADGRESARPGHGVTLAPFLIDAYEVTNAAFAAFLNTLAVKARRDVAARVLGPDDVGGADADRLWGGAGGNDRAFIAMDDTAARTAVSGGRFLPGVVLAGRYRIVGLLGKGGMGEVYRADDLKLGQAVALKFLPEALEQDEGRLQRFLHEVRTARQVSHSNVCRVYDIGEVDGHIVKCA